MDHLFAKSWRESSPPPASVFLAGHLRDVFHAAQSILRASTDAQLSAFGLHAVEWRKRLDQVICVASAIHDLGKANRYFQEMLQSPREWQPIRHEWLTFWIAEQPNFKSWLIPAVDGCEKLWHVMLFAVAGHHPKEGRTPPEGASNFNPTKPVEILTSHDDFRRCLSQITDWFNLVEPPVQIEGMVSSETSCRQSEREFQALVEKHEDFFECEIEPDSDWRRFCACAKACLIAADVAGSALWEQTDTRHQQESWIADALSGRPSGDDLQQIILDRLTGNTPYDFQESIADSAADVTLVQAGCGSGKTLAAYMWAKRQQSGRRLWFCYPTTGTATEGFRGYLLESDSKKAKYGADLFHSRASFDKVRLLESDDDGADESIRVESLKAWDTKIIACTVDTLLCLMQNQRRGLYAWPAIAQGAIVFDEVHCYDDVLFGNLLTFLRELPGIPVLLMTASLPTERRTAIEKACRQRSFKALSGPDDLESLPRYENPNTNNLHSRHEAEEAVREELDMDGRVLWVSNTVDRARHTGRLLSDCDPIIYHSRFIYTDRIEQHLKVTELFDTFEPGLASTSQVAEMSLDLGRATLLVTELSPIPALIQRLGRLNRRAHPSDLPSDRPPRRFMVIEPLHNEEFSSSPYDDPELEEARRFLAELGPGPLSQRDLIEAWHTIEQPTHVKPVQSAWLRGGIHTPVDAIRKSGYGVTVIRAEDVAKAKKEGVVGYTLPMSNPKREAWQAGTLRVGGFPVAGEGTIQYDSATGGEWSTYINV